ncbi:MAG: HPr family phosphocarrier protein [Chloroflexota bacterium]
MAQETEIVINHKDGLHLRPAALFVQTAASYNADIKVRNVTKDTDFQNAKSAIGVMMLKVGRGDTIAIRAEGADAADALEGLTGLVERGFTE